MLDENMIKAVARVLEDARRVGYQKRHQPGFRIGMLTDTKGGSFCSVVRVLWGLVDDRDLIPASEFICRTLLKVDGVEYNETSRFEIDLYTPWYLDESRN